MCHLFLHLKHNYHREDTSRPDRKRKKKYNNKKTETFVFLISACANNNRDITDQRPKLTKKTTTC